MIIMLAYHAKWYNQTKQISDIFCNWRYIIWLGLWLVSLALSCVPISNNQSDHKFQLTCTCRWNKPWGEIWDLKEWWWSTGIENTSAVTNNLKDTWWRHQMETFSTLLVLCEGNPLVTGEFPSQRPVTWSFDIFYELRLYKRMYKQ